MTTPRPAYKIDDEHPGSDLAVETSTAFAAAFIVFKPTDDKYENKVGELVLASMTKTSAFALIFIQLYT